MKILDILTEADEWYGQDFYAKSKKEGEKFEKEIQNWFSQLKGKRFTDDFGNIFELFNLLINISPRYDESQKAELSINLRVSYNFYDTKIPPTLYTAPLKLFIDRFKDYIKTNNIDMSPYSPEIQLGSSRIYFSFKDINMNNRDRLSDYLRNNDQFYATVSNIDNPESELQNNILHNTINILYGDFKNTFDFNKKGLTIFKAHSKGTVTINVEDTINNTKTDYQVNYTLTNPEFSCGAQPKVELNNTIGIGKIEKYINCELNVELPNTNNHREYIKELVLEKLHNMFIKFKIYLRIRPSY